ncbi:enoyl-CoA hydratase [Haloferax mucosum ATCC BAA-1512]|uniref:Enoyl-CoA hydratase n=1 Tax=Haloferax mucosum ATCC BAA-1512 TaxID=662479 RepID=M0IQQ9_9EURY|nr:enoyl-CoA hydratase-related protein [Haloferax mucosum]ELZ99035.1 enoyl-CoA hydratase [Haloferax mucosum ATCC BAA-1512]
MSWETLRLDWDGDVATITIDRPDHMNAMNKDTLDAFEEALDEAEAEEARVLVLTGAGDKSFIAGADISYMQDIGTPAAQKYAEQGHRIASRLEQFPAPTIAAINGYAFGGGLEFALACDLRVASERALLGQTEIDLGIMPGWGGSVRLPALVGDEVARRLIFFGERIDASDAHEYGIVGEVVAHDQLDSHIDELTADLASKPRHALAGAKAAINMSHEATRDAALDYEACVWSGLFGTHDQREGMSAFVEKRDPNFE